MNSNKMPKIFIFILIFNSGCTIKDNGQLQIAADKLDSATTAASNALDIEMKARPKTRRLEAIEYYIITKNIKQSTAAITPDLTKSDINGSFARFVCAGSNSMLREKGALEYVRLYSSGIRDILNPGEDSLGSQYNRFKKLQAAITNTVPLPEKPPFRARDNCIKDVNSLIGAWNPAPTSDDYDESPAAAIPLIIEAAKALHQVAIVLSKKVNDYEAKKIFSEYVKDNHEMFSKVMTDDFSEERINEAWKHRKGVALQMPLMTFKRIFDNENAAQSIEINNRIRELGMIANQQLSEFDVLKDTPAPSYVRKSIIEAEDKLLKMANNEDISMSDIVNFISGMIKDFKDIEKKYKDANDAIQSAVAAYKK